MHLSREQYNNEQNEASRTKRKHKTPLFTRINLQLK